jgi:two-component system, LytTR family, response regulator
LENFKLELGLSEFMKASVIVLDDEPEAIEQLVGYLKCVHWLELSATFQTAETSLRFLESNKVDIVLFNIAMLDNQQCELLKVAAEKTLIIFTARDSAFAVQSYDFGAVDYLLKPIAFDRFMLAINRTSVKLKSQKPVIDKVELLVNRRIRAIPINDIQYFQSYGNYIKVILENETLIVPTTTHDLESKLPLTLFVRIHKSFIVNRSKVSGLRQKSVFVGATTLPIGKTFYRYVRFVFDIVSE